MSTLYRRIKIKDCGNSWCTGKATGPGSSYGSCDGHVIDAQWQNTSDVGSVYIDGEYAFGGGDTLMETVAEIVGDLFADEPKYYITEKESQL